MRVPYQARFNRAWQILQRQGAASAGDAAPSYDAAAVALFAAMTTQPDATRKGLYNSLIASLKAGGVWDKLDAYLILAAPDTQAALLNIRAPGTYTAISYTGLTFTADRGYQGGGTGYISTEFNPVTAAGQHTRDSAHISTYTNSTTADVANDVVSFGRVSAVETFIRPRSSASTVTGRVNSLTNQSFGSVGTRLGGRILSRIGSADTRAYADGVQVGIPSTVPSAPMLSEPFALLRLGATFNTIDRLAAYSIGGGLTDTEAAALHTATANFLTAIGAN